MIPVIMAGGSGERLWPLSRAAYPKQFLKINSRMTLFQETIARLDSFNTAKPIVICNEEHRFLVAEQLRQQQIQADVLLEPVGRNTAPAIALAALHAIELNLQQPPVLLILPADHVVDDVKAFYQAVSHLRPLVEKGYFGTLGVLPRAPETGYGYICVGSEIKNEICHVVEFCEKPNESKAQEYIDNGNYLWNSGIYLIRADRYLEELKKYHPQILEFCERAIKTKKIDQDFIRIDTELFLACPDNSIDYAVMEPLCNQNNSQVVVMPLNTGWSDVGSWSELWKISDKDEQGNAVTVGDKLSCEDVILQDSNNSFVSAHSKLVALLGVKNLVVVDTDNALLVADKSRVQDIKSIVCVVKDAGRREHLNHRAVYRPWGKYDTVDMGYRYQVKHIVVNPGAKLSLQMHHHRAEHWVVVSGTAKVTCEDKVFLMTENQSTYIPVGSIHRLENPGKVPLEIIEIQSGNYLEEDDIVRLEDSYNR